MARVKIRKVDGHWTSTTPPLGFTGTPTVRHHPSHADAIRAHTGRGALASGGCTTELSYPQLDVLAIRSNWGLNLPRLG